MVSLENLKFATKQIDTSMAEEYVKQINESIEWPENGQYLVEKKANDITKCNSLKDIKSIILKYKIKSSDQAIIGQALAKKLTENTEMLVQLEYLTRRTDPRDVRDGHVKLMSQLLTCSSTLWNSVPVWHCKVLSTIFTETTPLYHLASVISSLCCDQSEDKPGPGIVVTEKGMIPLCKYFVELCHDVGLYVAIVYANPEDLIEMENYCSFLQEPDSIGCTGVVAERSDMDSAIDVFIDSSVTAPWRLTQVYVQESVFEEFKDALAAKARVDGTNHSLLVGDKTFLIESLQSGPVGIPVHGYRTTKELLTLIKTPYLSVWAAESALSHEIALRSSSSTIWVNDYGSFDGPPRACLSVYNVIFEVMGQQVPDSTMKSLESWTNLKRDERFEVISAALKAIDAKKPDDIKWDLIQHDDNFLHVTEKTICFGIPKSGVLKHCRVSIVNAVKVLMVGNAVALGIGYVGRNEDIDFHREFLTQLKNRGAPIHEMTWLPPCSAKNINPTNPMVLEELKVIRTNYGTIFAN